MADLYSNPWDGVTLGRIDSDVVGPNKVPAVDAPVEEIRVGWADARRQCCRLSHLDMLSKSPQ